MTLIDSIAKVRDLQPVVQMDDAERKAMFARMRGGTGKFRAVGRAIGSTRSTERGRAMIHQAHASLMTPDGGFSVDIRTGKSPTKGYMVAQHGHEHVMSVSRVRPDHLHRYAENHAHALTEKNNYFGGWHNPADGKAYFDVSHNVSSHDEAIRQGVHQRQLAIFHLSNFTSEPLQHHHIDAYEQKHGSLDEEFGPGTSKRYRAAVQKNLEGLKKKT